MSKLWDFILDNKRMVGALTMLFILNGLSFEPNSGGKAEAHEEATNVGTITQNYHSGHSGIDIAQKRGAEILSLTAGKVVKVGDEDKYCSGRGFGRFVMVEDKVSGFTFLYAHLQDQFVEEGEKVARFDSLGTVGLTGKVTGPHIHLSIFKTKTLETKDHVCGERLTGETVDPEEYLK